MTGASALLDTPVAERMYIDQGEVLRVRVEADEFCDDEPGPPRAAEGVATRREPTRPPYIVCVRCFCRWLWAYILINRSVFYRRAGSRPCGVVEWCGTGR